jgi:hypothetical protein
MANQVENLRQGNLAKLPFFSGDKTDTFTCEQWITRIQRSKDTSGWDNAHTMMYVLNALHGSAFAWTHSINCWSNVDINNWDSFKVLNTFLVLQRTTTIINMTSLLQGTNEQVTNYYIRVIDAINDIKYLKKLNQHPLPAAPWAEAADVPQFMALGVNNQARILLNLVDFGIQDCLNYVYLNLFVSGLKPHTWEEIMRQAPKVLDDAFDMVIQSEKINFTPLKTQGATALLVMPVDQSDSSLPTDESEADLLATLKDIEADNKRRIAAVKAKLNKLCRPGQSFRNCSSSNGASGKSMSGSKKPNPDKNVKGSYCNKMGHH